MNTRPMRVVLVDDHIVLREGLRRLLQSHPEIRVVGEASTGAQATELVINEAPDVVVLDLALGGEDGLVWARETLAKGPAPRIVVLSSDAEGGRVQEAMRLGISGYVVKTSSAEEVVRALRLAHDGHLYLCPEVMTAMLRVSSFVSEDSIQSDGKERISARDRELIRLVALGLRNKEIAEQLHLSAKTVETYRVRLMHRIGCESTADLVRWAIRERLVTP